MKAPQPLPRIPAAEEIIPAVKRIISRYEALCDEIIQTITPSMAAFDTVMQPLAELDNETAGELEARKLFIEAEASRNANGDLFQLLRAIQERDDSLDAESKHLLEETLLDYKISGCGVLNHSQKKNYIQNSLQLDDLTSSFQRNIVQECGGLWFTEQELDGVPSSELERWQTDGLSKDVSGLGMKFVPFSNGGTMAILTYAHSLETRKKMFIADDAKMAVNISLMDNIIKLRHELAHSLGYSTHAAYRMERRLLKHPKQVESFLSNLSAGLIGRGRKELEILQRRRQIDISEKGGSANIETQPFPAWDLCYYRNIVEQDSHIDHAKMSEYFPLDYTAAAMLRIFESSLGLRFIRIPNEEVGSNKIWHDTVQAFSVWDGSGENEDFVGYLYFDLLWGENKFRGAHNVTMEPGYLKPDGSRHYPSTILMCAFPTPTQNRCALLTHKNVVTLFHELGHAIHSLVSKTKYSRFHGTRLPSDFVEMPSVLLENWCWMPDVLQGMSCHYTNLDPQALEGWRKDHTGAADPPAKIPIEMVQTLARRRYVNRGLYHLNQLAVSMFDLKIHNFSSDEEIANLNTKKLWYDLHEQLRGIDFSVCKESGADLVSFHHLVAGYDVGYYSYLVCAAFSQDMFRSLFADAPHSKAAWCKYRCEILEPGASQSDLLGMLGGILGRPANSEALVRMLEEAEL
ncbi:Saccharolysin [Cladobotryum mycophilum]|uniref:Saccharolysin n=1 Tax=Cladobotryum mycophilum TaxID=491253 RepID=A0ABR0SUF3_9HYPO